MLNNATATTTSSTTDHVHAYQHHGATYFQHVGAAVVGGPYDMAVTAEAFAPEGTTPLAPFLLGVASVCGGPELATVAQRAAAALGSLGITSVEDLLGFDPGSIPVPVELAAVVRSALRGVAPLLMPPPPPVMVSAPPPSPRHHHHQPYAPPPSFFSVGQPPPHHHHLQQQPGAMLLQTSPTGSSSKKGLPDEPRIDDDQPRHGATTSHHHHRGRRGRRGRSSPPVQDDANEKKAPGDGEDDETGSSSAAVEQQQQQQRAAADQQRNGGAERSGPKNIVLTSPSWADEMEEDERTIKADRNQLFAPPLLVRVEEVLRRPDDGTATTTTATRAPCAHGDAPLRWACAHASCDACSVATGGGPGGLCPVCDAPPLDDRLAQIFVLSPCWKEEGTAVERPPAAVAAVPGALLDAETAGARLRAAADVFGRAAFCRTRLAGVEFFLRAGAVCDAQRSFWFVRAAERFADFAHRFDRRLCDDCDELRMTIRRFFVLGRMVEVIFGQKLPCHVECLSRLEDIMNAPPTDNLLKRIRGHFTGCHTPREAAAVATTTTMLLAKKNGRA